MGILLENWKRGDFGKIEGKHDSCGHPVDRTRAISFAERRIPDGAALPLPLNFDP
jgi:hypothetical protein